MRGSAHPLFWISGDSPSLSGTRGLQEQAVHSWSIPAASPLVVVATSAALAVEDSEALFSLDFLDADSSSSPKLAIVQVYCAIQGLSCR